MRPPEGRRHAARGNGVSDNVADMCHKYRLPMYGFAESLNAAVAAGILIYELARQMHAE